MKKFGLVRTPGNTTDTNTPGTVHIPKLVTHILGPPVRRIKTPRVGPTPTEVYVGVNESVYESLGLERRSLSWDFLLD